MEAGASTAVGGATEIDFRVAELTVRDADPFMPPKAAVMFVVPAATAVATPSGPTVATAVSLDVQVESVVMTCVLESLNVPVAVNDNSVVGGMVRPVGATEMDTIVALVTSRDVEPLIELPPVPRVAVMVVVAPPGLSPLANPVLVPMVAAAVFKELQVTSAVRL